MANRTEQLQAVIDLYKEATGEKEIDMHDVADWAMKTHGVRAPKPQTAVDLLAKELSKAAREKIKHDESTGHPYRVHHALPHVDAKGQVRMSWFNIDESPPSL